MKKFSYILLLLATAMSAHAQQMITFPSKDGVTITADEYITNDTLPYMILCHQAGYSRGEYLESAKRFQKLGYNCLAIDQRSGKSINGERNETAFAALGEGKPTSYLDAEQDIIAAIDYVYAKSKKKVILTGSSYSASLVLKIATDNDKVKAVMAFSPGEYFGDKLNLRATIKDLDKPVFVTSTQEEAANVKTLMQDVKSTRKTQFVPANIGEHGSKTLWTSLNPNNQEYWLAVILFTQKLK